MPTRPAAPSIYIGSELQRGLTPPPAAGHRARRPRLPHPPHRLHQSQKHPPIRLARRSHLHRRPHPKNVQPHPPEIEARADAQLDRWFAPNPDLTLP